ncbi:L,D-transpeptidase [Sulfurimonas sp.]|uniref:L,D-transpeptidase n=1 Tax=Sulfurimonas sp. TaxID=2022749 RepID=UPI0025FDDF48|nr:L,D-transpeptidase [Sulfurimonas sp.]
MRIFFRLSIFFILLSSLLQASSLNVVKIQNDFYYSVIIKPLYAKYHKKSLVDKALKQRRNKFRIYNSYWKRAKKELFKKSKHLTSSQFLTLVDLSKQVILVVLWDNEAKNFYPVGYDFVSTGNINREKDVKRGEDHYFKTPAGFFNIKSGWRSDGKVYSDNFTKPYGKKDSYVFYFGEQKGIRYNTFDKNKTKIKDPKKWQLISDKLKLAMHAHISTAPLGTPQSHGCVRISSELNAYLDNNLVFFKHLYDGKKWTHSYKKPPIKPKNYELAGEYMLVLNKI